MPQIENVTQIKLKMPKGGHPNGVKHEKSKAVMSEYKPHHQKAQKKEKTSFGNIFEMRHLVISVTF